VEVTSAGHSRVPEPSTQLKRGDLVSFIVAAGSLGRLHGFLDGKWSWCGSSWWAGRDCPSRSRAPWNELVTKVTVIDTDPGRESALAKAGLRAVMGAPTVPATLEAAGALRADVLVAATTSDETNLVVALLAKQHFAIARVIGRVNDAANEELFDASWGVDALVSPSTAIVSMVRPPP